MVCSIGVSACPPIPHFWTTEILQRALVELNKIVIVQSIVAATSKQTGNRLLLSVYKKTNGECQKLYTVADEPLE